MRYLSIGNALGLTFLGIPSCFLGGFIGDKFEPKFGPMKGYIAGIGALLAGIPVFVCFILQINFAVSLSCMIVSYIFAEVWYGPFFAMASSIFPAEMQGFGKICL